LFDVIVTPWSYSHEVIKCGNFTILLGYYVIDAGSAGLSLRL